MFLCRLLLSFLCLINLECCLSYTVFKRFYQRAFSLAIGGKRGITASQRSQRSYWFSKRNLPLNSSPRLVSASLLLKQPTKSVLHLSSFWYAQLLRSAAQPFQDGCSKHDDCKLQRQLVSREQQEGRSESRGKTEQSHSRKILGVYLITTELCTVN